MLFLLDWLCYCLPPAPTGLQRKRILLSESDGSMVSSQISRSAIIIYHTAPAKNSQLKERFSCCPHSASTACIAQSVKEAALSIMRRHATTSARTRCLSPPKRSHARGVVDTSRQSRHRSFIRGERLRFRGF